MNYPIELKYTQNNLPVEIIDEFDVWRKIKDSENNIGWLHKSLIKGDRFVLTVDKKNVQKLFITDQTEIRLVWLKKIIS